MRGPITPSAPHEESPPPEYCEVVQDNPPPPPPHQRSINTPLLLTGVCLTFFSFVVLAALVGDLLFRLDLLEVRLEHRHEKELEKVKQQMAMLATSLDNLKQSETDHQDKLDLLSRRIDGLSEAFKTGDAKYLVSRAENVQVTQMSTFLVISLFITRYYSF